MLILNGPLQMFIHCHNERLIELFAHYVAQSDILYSWFNDVEKSKKFMMAYYGYIRSRQIDENLWNSDKLNSTLSCLRKLCVWTATPSFENDLTHIRWMEWISVLAAELIETEK